MMNILHWKTEFNSMTTTGILLLKEQVRNIGEIHIKRRNIRPSPSRFTKNGFKNNQQKFGQYRRTPDKNRIKQPI